MLSRGERMLAAMHLRGMTKQHALAHALRVNESTITRWKNNGPMSVDNAILLCRELDISLDWFLNGTGTAEAHKAAPLPATPSKPTVLAYLQDAELALSPRARRYLIAFVESILSDDKAR